MDCQILWSQVQVNNDMHVWGINLDEYVRFMRVYGEIEDGINAVSRTEKLKIHFGGSYAGCLDSHVVKFLRGWGGGEGG